MPFIRKIEARAYARATEVFEKVSDAILGIFPENVRQNVAITEEKAEGQSGDSISILSGVLTIRDDCEITFNNILKHLEKRERRAIKRSLDLRVNNNGVFFLRIDKQGAFLGKIRLANNTDVIRARFYFKDRPRCKKEDAILLIEKRLQDAED
ncbi:MAG: RNA-binding domain-containing protein [Candidatus Thorarchaeota archaeon]